MIVQYHMNLNKKRICLAVSTIGWRCRGIIAELNGDVWYNIGHDFKANLQGRGAGAEPPAHEDRGRAFRRRRFRRRRADAQAAERGRKPPPPRLPCPSRAIEEPPREAAPYREFFRLA